LHALS
jgi:hypothetical protein